MLAETISRSIRTNILVGLFLITPLIITLIIIYFLFTFVTNYLVPNIWLQTELGLLYRLIALILVMIGLYFIGLLTRNIIGRSLYRLGDRIMTRIPIIKSIYIAVRRVSESLISTRSVMFRQVVAIQFLRSNIYSIGFLTAQLPPELSQEILPNEAANDHVCVFVPTVPNPTSGFLLMVSRQEIKPLKISVVNAMKMILSAGTVLPTNQDEAKPPSLLDHLEEWITHKPKDPQAKTPKPSADSPLP